MHFTDKVALQKSTALSKSADDFVIDTWTPLDSSGNLIVCETGRLVRLCPCSFYFFLDKVGLGGLCDSV